jgi:hypothetical protein
MLNQLFSTQDRQLLALAVQNRNALRNLQSLQNLCMRTVVLNFERCRNDIIFLCKCSDYYILH